MKLFEYNSYSRVSQLKITLFYTFFMLLCPSERPFAQSVTVNKNSLEVLFYDSTQYCAFPMLHRVQNGYILSFDWNTSRSHYGRVAGGKSGSHRLFYDDRTKIWSNASEDLRGSFVQFKTDDSIFVTFCSNGHEEIIGDKIIECENKGIILKRWSDNKYSASYRMKLQRWDSKGKLLLDSIFTYPEFGYIQSFRTGIRTKGSVWLLPVYCKKIGATAWESWVLRSTDSGLSWKKILIGSNNSHYFSETEVLEIAPDTILAMIRSDEGDHRLLPSQHGYLWKSISTDGGTTWATPQQTKIWGYPAHLLKLQDGKVLCTYGYRRPPYGIRASVSDDNGKTWDTDHEYIIDSLAFGSVPYNAIPNKSDLGYPVCSQISKDSVYTVYYTTDNRGVTYIAAKKWSLKEPKQDISVRSDQRPIDHHNPALSFEYMQMQSFIPQEDTIWDISIYIDTSSHAAMVSSKKGLSVALRKPEKDTWFSPLLAESKPLFAKEIYLNRWNISTFEPPCAVKRGEYYVLTVYNRDHKAYGSTTPVFGFSGQPWYTECNINSEDYSYGGIEYNETTDIRFLLNSVLIK